VTARLAGVAIAVLAASACSRAVFTPPAGPGEPFLDAEAAWSVATARCRTARTYAVAAQLSGRAGDQRLWPVHLDIAVTADQQIYVGATAAGQGVFVLAGTADRATLWLRREHRVVTAPPADMLERLVGVRFDPARLLAVLTGCVTARLDVVRAARHGRLVAIETPDARVFLERRGRAWETKAGAVEGMIVEYAREGTSLPLRVWISSDPARRPVTAVGLRVEDAELNGTLPAGVFEPPPGASGAAPMTLDELRAAGPLRGGPPVVP
jgi:hypothetical protein